jgi:hypothetical protein
VSDYKTPRCECGHKKSVHTHRLLPLPDGYTYCECAAPCTCKRFVRQPDALNAEPDPVKELIRQAVAAEREACAAVADAERARWMQYGYGPHARGCELVAEKIRARAK